MVLGYFFTFTTYGTWLHGSEKGSVDREHNVYGEAPIEPDPALRAYRQKLMKQAPYLLGDVQRKLVLAAVRAHTQIRGWFLWAAHVRTNHVHIVLGPGDGRKTPERMMTEIKAYASRAINDAEMGKKPLTGVRGSEQREHWTRHGSTRHLHTEDAVNRAIYYTLYEQGPPMEVYEAPRPEPRTPVSG